MLYRRFQPSDLAQLYAIEEACFQPPFRFSRDYMHELVLSTTTATWIAEENGRMAGFAIVDLDPAAGKAVAYIQTIEVAPEWRGQGIGHALLYRMESSAREANARTVWLHVDVENSAAIRLYESHGYIRQRRAENYYARNRAAFVYAKPLTET